MLPRFPWGWPELVDSIIPMAFNNPHPDDITQQLLRYVSFLLVLSVAGVIALLMVQPSSY